MKAFARLIALAAVLMLSIAMPRAFAEIIHTGGFFCWFFLRILQ